MRTASYSSWLSRLRSNLQGIDMGHPPSRGNRAELNQLNLPVRMLRAYCSERPERRAENDNSGQSEQRADDPDHDDPEIALAVARSAERQQSDHRAIVGQDIEGA